MSGLMVKALVPGVLSLPEWQSGIDGIGFLVRMVLDPEQPEQERGLWRARLGPERVTFRFELAERPPERGAENPDPYRYEASVPSGGELRLSAAGLVALLGYVSRSRGILSPPFPGEPPRVDEMRKSVDAMLAVAVGETEEYLQRYPEDRASPGGRTVIEVRRAQ